MKIGLLVLLWVYGAAVSAQTPRDLFHPQALAQAGAQHHAAVLKLLSQPQARQQVWHNMRHCRNPICNLSADSIFFGKSVRTTPAKLMIHRDALVKAGVLSRMFGHDVWHSDITWVQGQLRVDTLPSIPLVPPMRTYQDTLTL